METVSFKLPAELRARLAQEAKRRQVRQSTIIRESLEQALARNGKDVTCADLAADLIGSVEGPRDLSTNSAYLREALTQRRRRAQRHR
jgi:predicted DNA-binding protein